MVAHRGSRPCPVLSPSCDIAVSLERGRGVKVGVGVNVERSKVEQALRISKHFPNNRFVVSRASYL